MNFTRQTIQTFSAAQEGPKQETAKLATVNIRVDANCTMLCDGEYIETQFQAKKITKMNLPIGQHLLEFFDIDYPDIIIEQEVDWPEEGKSYLVNIKGLQEKIEAAQAAKDEKKRLEAERKAKAEAERKAKEEAERKAKIEAERKAKIEAERKAKEEAERKAKEEIERKAKAEAEQKAKAKAEAAKKAAEAAEKLKKMTNGHAFVDFGIKGMSALWATCNIGASSPEKYGDLFAWGETQTKTEFKGANHKYTKCIFGLPKDSIKYTKKDGNTQLEIVDDAARAKWGGQWQIPTEADFMLLFYYCTVEEATVNGIAGIRFSKNGKSIFLPKAGAGGFGSFAKKGEIGRYWTSSVVAKKSGDKTIISDETTAMSIYLHGNKAECYDSILRYCGLSIRPIIRK